jgi:hypothetical protein
VKKMKAAALLASINMGVSGYTGDAEAPGMFPQVRRPPPFSCRVCQMGVWDPGVPCSHTHLSVSVPASAGFWHQVRL